MTARKEVEKTRASIWESIIDRAEVLHDACVIRDRSAAAVERLAGDIAILAKALPLVGDKPGRAK